MHDRPLHDALAALADDAATLLSDAMQTGAEIPFELADLGSKGAPLWCYRPQTARFLGDSITDLALLPGYAAAVRALERQPGLGAYLRTRGKRSVPGGPRPRADAAVRSFLGAVFDGATAFEVVEAARFHTAYEELERALYAGRTLTCVAVAIEGLAIASPELHLADGLSLVRKDALHDAPDDLDPSAATVALVRDERRPDDGPALEDAARSLRRLQSALRLWDAAAPALSPFAHTRSDGGPWLPVALAVGTRRAQGTTTLEPDDEDPFRAFCALVARRTPRGGTLAWALRRYELGVERPLALEALSDWLLAARALLEPEGPQVDMLADRMAAICAAAGPDRDALADRLDDAIVLERAAIHGSLRGEPHLLALAEEFGGCLRAILRDVLCGHLDPDLRALADALLTGEPAPAQAGSDENR